MTLGSDRLHRRRCIGFRIAFIFGILLAVINRDDWTLLCDRARQAWRSS